MSKSIEKCKLSRGAFLGAQAMCAGLGVLLIDGVGAALTKSDSRNPFYMCIASESFIILVTIILALTK